MFDTAVAQPTIDLYLLLLKQGYLWVLFALVLKFLENNHRVFSIENSLNLLFTPQIFACPRVKYQEIHSSVIQL